MTQPNHSAHKRLAHLHKKPFARSLPAQSLCWLSSLSLLGSGFVVAQTESSIDNIVPTIENSQPTQPVIIQNTVKTRQLNREELDNSQNIPNGASDSERDYAKKQYLNLQSLSDSLPPKPRIRSQLGLLDAPDGS